MGSAESIARGEVHVWLIGLDVGERESALLEGFLSPLDRHRALEMEGSRRARYVAARGYLRAILSSYLGRPPGSIEILAVDGGKPRLRDDELNFNVSHSGSLGAVAVCGGAGVGIDIERLRPLVRWESVAKRFLPAAEIARLRSLSDGRRSEAFARHWTAFEAQLKASGYGLSGGARIVPDRYALTEFVPAAGWIGALAVEGTPKRIRWKHASHLVSERVAAGRCTESSKRPSGLREELLDATS